MSLRKYDFAYHYVRFYNYFGRPPNIKNKTIWDLLFKTVTKDIDDPIRKLISDNEFVKTYIKNKIGEEYVIPTYGFIRRKEEVDSFKFPDTCACKYNSHIQRYFFKTNDYVNKEEIKSWFGFDYYPLSRERNYKDLEHKVIVEEIVGNNPNQCDYRFWCLDGDVKFIQVDLFERLGRLYGFKQQSKTFDSKWNELDIQFSTRDKIKHIVPRPKKFDLMLELAHKLSSPIKGLIRVDFFIDKDNILVGELTNYPFGGCNKVETKEQEKLLNDTIFRK